MTKAARLGKLLEAIVACREAGDFGGSFLSEEMDHVEGSIERAMIQAQIGAPMEEVTHRCFASRCSKWVTNDFCDLHAKAPPNLKAAWLLEDKMPMPDEDGDDEKHF